MGLCSTNFVSKYAYIKSCSDNKLLLNDPISIDEYNDNIELRNQRKSKIIMLCCKNGHQLKPYRSNRVKHHFKHINLSDESGGLMSLWHNKWQGEFCDIEVPHPKLHGGHSNRIADVLVNNIVVEIQHSYISQNEVDCRVHDYSLHGKSVHWIIDCNEKFKVEYLDVSETYMLTFTGDTWKYESFINQKFVFLHHKDNIYKIEPVKVKSKMIDVRECKHIDSFVEAYKLNIINNIWDTTDLPQCTLYHNQRGAGCGKTYESIQLLSNEDKFKHKRTYIYLTKAHSAKEVIFNEFQEQFKQGKLVNISLCNDTDVNVSGRQYKILYKDLRSGEDCSIIIGTIDSFMYALGNKQNKKKDFFEGLVESIKQGHLEVTSNGNVKYARSSIDLNKKCLLLIDEAQDLNKNYIEAIAQIMRSTYIDAYIIGDKLQSIWGEENIYTYLENNDLPHTNKILNIGENHVRRFHNVKFIKFVNNVIDFEKYQLKKVSAICDGNCKYTHENDIEPVTLLYHPKIYSDEKDNTKLNQLIDKLISYVRNDIQNYGYLPNNFLFIFPVMKKNSLAVMLETKLQEFWIKQFADVTYQNDVLSQNSYWKTRINNGEFYNYVYLHKSDENKPINIKESENATRILSIHSSKGLGCEVVFLLNLTEESLKLFSKETGNLVYDSLLHVAITRQKKKLYIGVVDDKDDIYERLLKTTNDIIHIRKPNISGISAYNKVQEVCTFVKEHYFEDTQKLFCDVFRNAEKIIEINNDDVNQSNTNNTTIDWGHHVIRYCVFCYSLMFNIMNDYEHAECSINNQYMTIINNISKLIIKTCHHQEYHNELKNITNLNRLLKGDAIDKFPILTFSIHDCEKNMYKEYHNVIKDTIQKVQKKLLKESKNNKLPALCPLEMIIVVHMIKIYTQGMYNDEVTMMDLYNIIHAFHTCWETSGVTHSEFNCSCNKHFSKPLQDKQAIDGDIAQSIKSHHEIVAGIKTIFNCFKLSWKNVANNEKLTYNIQHRITLHPHNSSKDFTIWNPNIPFIGNSENFVLYPVIQPSLNKLNINDVIINCLINTYLIQNSKQDTNNFERFNNKKVIICIFTFSKLYPIILDIDTTFAKDKLKFLLSEFLFSKYTRYNRKIINLYNYLKQNRKDKTKSGLDLLIEEIENISPKPLEYVLNFLVIQKENIKKVSIAERQQMISLQNIDNFLKTKIQNYLFENEIEEYDY